MTVTKTTGESDKRAIFFFGSSEFSLPILSALLPCYRQRLVVITTAAAKRGRHLKPCPTVVADYARANNLQLIEVKRLTDPELRAALEDGEPVVGVSASFGMLFPQAIIAALPKGILNVHPSLLPRYRGPSPIQWAILEGDRETGVTIFLVEEKLDHGPMLVQERFPLALDMTTPQLSQKLAAIGGELIVNTLPQWLEGKLTPTPQDHARATTTQMLTREHGRINWQKDDAAKIERMIRAFAPWPGAWCMIKKIISPEPSRRAIDEQRDMKRLKILAAEQSQKSDLQFREVRLPEIVRPPGSVFLKDELLAIQTIKGVLFPTLLQLEGGKPLDPQRFLLGHPWIVKTQLGK